MGINGDLLQYSCLENSMDRGAWRATVYGVAKSWTWLDNGACNGKTRLGTWTELSVTGHHGPTRKEMCWVLWGRREGDLASVWLFRKPFLRKEELNWSQKDAQCLPQWGAEEAVEEFLQRKSLAHPMTWKASVTGTQGGRQGTLLHTDGETEAQQASVFPEVWYRAQKGWVFPRWQLFFQHH